MTQTFHATVVGVDRPGVTARMFAALTGATVLDVEQVVVAGQLVLGAVLQARDGFGEDLATRLSIAVPDFEVAVRAVDAAALAGPSATGTVTIVGRTIGAEAVSQLAAAVARSAEHLKVQLIP